MRIGVSFAFSLLVKCKSNNLNRLRKLNRAESPRDLPCCTGQTGSWTRPGAQTPDNLHQLPLLPRAVSPPRRGFFLPVLEQVPQHVVQDTAVAVVQHLL